MKIVLDISKDFERHFNDDRFKDSLERIETDIHNCINETVQNVWAISGNYELELIDMLVAAFKKAEVFHSTCTLEGIPIYKMNCDDIWNESYDKRDGAK